MSKLFRKKAMATLATPEQLDTLLRVTNPVAWLALLAATVLTVATLAWAILGSLAVTIDGPGVVLPEAGLRVVPSLLAGSLTEVVAQRDQVVKSNTVVARMRPVTAVDGDSRIEISTDRGGRVLEVLVRPGEYIEQGQALAVLCEPGAALECVGYFAFDQGDKLAPGMPVRVLPSNAREDVYGALIGTVVSVAPYPTSRPEMAATLVNPQLVDLFLAGGTYQQAPVEVRIHLDRDLDDPSGYAWTSGHGPKHPVQSGTSCQIQVVTEYVRPIELILPKIKDFFDGAVGEK